MLAGMILQLLTVAANCPRLHQLSSLSCWWSSSAFFPGNRFPINTTCFPGSRTLARLSCLGVLPHGSCSTLALSRSAHPVRGAPTEFKLPFLPRYVEQRILPFLLSRDNNRVGIKCPTSKFQDAATLPFSTTGNSLA